jgi:hypothetical protein
MEDTNMKKTYINPELVVVKLQTMQMLASSINLGLSEESIVDEGNLLTREADFELEEEDNYDYDLDEEDF